MKDKAFNMAILGVVGIVLLVGVVLVLNGSPQGKVVVSRQVEQQQPVQSAPAEGDKCLDGGSCRTLQLCSSVSDGLYTDGVSMGCVNGEANSGIPYCGRLTRAQGSEPCNYADKNPRCVCP